jgi:hypothetical protein
VKEQYPSASITQPGWFARLATSSFVNVDTPHPYEGAIACPVWGARRNRVSTRNNRVGSKALPPACYRNKKAPELRGLRVEAPGIKARWYSLAQPSDDARHFS